MGTIFHKDRIEWIDITRGWAMGLVILAHTSIPSKLSSYIYSFHVPLFFIISGFLLHGSLNKSPGEFIKNKFTRLVIPYFFFSFIAYVYWLFARSVGWDAGALQIDPLTPLNGTLMAIRGSDFMTHNSALWFICSLFVSEIVFYLIFRAVKGNKVFLGMSILTLLIIGIVYNTFINVPLAWSLDTVPMVVAFLGLGFALKEYYPKWLAFKKRKYVTTLAILGAICVSVTTWYLNKTPVGTVDMFYGVYGIFLLYFICAFSGSIAVILLFEAFASRFKPLGYIGKNSLIIYALHQKVIFGLIGVVFVYFLDRATPLAGSSSLDKLGNGLIYLALTIIIFIPIIWFLNKYCAPAIGMGLKRRRTSAEADIR